MTEASGGSGSLAVVDVAIVGAGFSGVACTIACSNRLPATKRIALIGAQPPGRGAAYGTTSPRLLMNGPARAMSALADDEMNLVKRAHVTEHALIPRRDYSIYLQGLLDDALVRHPGITVHRDEIVDIAGDNDRLAVRGAQGATWHARSVVLALGNSVPSSSFLPTALCEYRGFIADPWSIETVPDGDVLCIGAGLTAMDVVALADRPGNSVVHLVSRHGRLPEIEDPYAHAFDPVRLSLDPSSSASTFRSVRAAVARYVEEGGDWRDIFETLRPISQTIWSGWDVSQRRRFLRHVAPIFGPLRYRVPPETFAAFARMRGAGRIVVHRGSVCAARLLDDGKIAVEIADGLTRRAVAVSCAINCTGPNDDVERSSSPLIARLLERGLARSHPLRMGFDAIGLRIIDARGETGKLFALGPILRGALYETTAVNEIREQAREIARTLAS